MADGDQTNGQTGALTFIEACAESSDLTATIADFKNLIRSFGFTNVACGAWAGVGQQRSHRFFFNDWPEAWLKIYEERDIFPVDPFLEESRRTMTPFLWSEIEHTRPLTPRGREVYKIGREFGWREVIGVPIHGPAGYQGIVSIATMKDVQLSPTDRACLEMTSRAIHDKCRKQIGFGLKPEDLPKLTPRELECMQWVAAGKSNWEIGQVLNISEATAHFHIENAKKKLDKSTRTEAVAVLLMHGLI
jgi:DNA-binding CsgD family transcriptional regulator